jgi:hypothetical protein
MSLGTVGCIKHHGLDFDFINVEVTANPNIHTETKWSFNHTTIEKCYVWRI